MRRAGHAYFITPCGLTRGRGNTMYRLSDPRGSVQEFSIALLSSILIDAGHKPKALGDIEACGESNSEGSWGKPKGRRANIVGRQPPAGRSSHCFAWESFLPYWNMTSWLYLKRTLVAIFRSVTFSGVVELNHLTTPNGYLGTWNSGLQDCSRITSGSVLYRWMKERRETKNTALLHSKN